MYFRTAGRKVNIRYRIGVDIYTLFRYGKMKFDKLFHENKS
nr:MAG TPA: hypothetical protein [Caudoviricetes sp.]